MRSDTSRRQAGPRGRWRTLSRAEKEARLAELRRWQEHQVRSELRALDALLG